MPHPVIALHSIFLSALLSLLGLTLPSQAFAEQSLSTYQVTYTAAFKGQKGKALRRLVKKNEHDYELSLDVDVKLLFLPIKFHYASQFTLIDDEHIRPRAYQYGGIVRRDASNLSFDWENMRVVNDDKGNSWQQDLVNEAQDELSYQEQIRLDLIKNKEELDYFIVDRDDEIRHREFEILGEEMVKGHWGEVKAIKVRLKRTNTDRQTLIWFAPEWDYLLVRLKHYSSSFDYEFNFTEAYLNGKKLPQP